MARSDKDELIKSDDLSLMHTYDLAPRDFGAHEAAPQGGDRRLHQRPNYKSAILLGISYRARNRPTTARLSATNQQGGSLC